MLNRSIFFLISVRSIDSRDETPTVTQETGPPHLPRGLSEQTLLSIPFALCLSDPRQTDNPIVYVNRAFTRLTGYEASAVLGRNCRFLQGPGTDREDVARLRKGIEANEEFAIDLLNYRADGTTFKNRLMITPLYEDGAVGSAEGPAFFLGVQTHNSLRTADEDRMTQLDEQLRELQHRVKNHLSMILAMVRLEARTGDPAQAIKVLARRVETLSVLYDQLSGGRAAAAGEAVPLGSYLGRICAATQDLTDPGSVRVNVDMGEIDVPVDAAGQIGLILSEVLNNSLKHAFPDGRRGEIRVSLRASGEDVVLSVADDGVGFHGHQWPRAGSLGGRIVAQLIERIGGHLDVRDEDGITVTLTMARSGLTG